MIVVYHDLCKEYFRVGKTLGINYNCHNVSEDPPARVRCRSPHYFV